MTYVPKCPCRLGDRETYLKVPLAISEAALKGNYNFCNNSNATAGQFAHVLTGLFDALGFGKTRAKMEKIKPEF